MTYHAQTNPAYLQARLLRLRLICCYLCPQDSPLLLQFLRELGQRVARRLGLLPLTITRESIAVDVL